MKLYAVILALVFTVACSTTVTGPITKNKYNLDIGCTDNMRDYQRTRKDVVKADTEKSTSKKIDLDCPVAE